MTPRAIYLSAWIRYIFYRCLFDAVFSFSCARRKNPTGSDRFRWLRLGWELLLCGITCSAVVWELSLHRSMSISGCCFFLFLRRVPVYGLWQRDTGNYFHLQTQRQCPVQSKYPIHPPTHTKLLCLKGEIVLQIHVLDSNLSSCLFLSRLPGGFMQTERPFSLTVHHFPKHFI